MKKRVPHKLQVCLLVLILGLFGCASTSAVKEATGEDTISSLSISCDKPYRLTQDCSIWSGATRKISIEGFDLKVASSENGDVILVMDANWLSNTALEGLTWNLVKNYHSEATNNSFEAVKKVMNQNGVKILRVRPIIAFKNIDGYILELDGDGYSIVKEYTRK